MWHLADNCHLHTPALNPPTPSQIACTTMFCKNLENWSVRFSDHCSPQTSSTTLHAFHVLLQND